MRGALGHVGLGHKQASLLAYPLIYFARPLADPDMSVFLARRWWRRRAGLRVNAAPLNLVVNPSHDDLSGGVLCFVLGSAFFHCQGISGRAEQAYRGDGSETTKQNHAKFPCEANAVALRGRLPVPTDVLKKSTYQWRPHWNCV